MKPATPRQSRQRGFALLFALTLLLMVGVTLAVMTATFGGEIRRMRFDRTQTQLRQLLLAGEAIAQAQLANHTTTQPMNVELPAALSRQGAKLTITGNAQRMHIEAQMGRYHAAQIVSFTKNNRGWQISNVQLAM